MTKLHYRLYYVAKGAQASCNWADYIVKVATVVLVYQHFSCVHVTGVQVCVLTLLAGKPTFPAPVCRRQHVVHQCVECRHIIHQCIVPLQVKLQQAKRTLTIGTMTARLSGREMVPTIGTTSQGIEMMENIM